MEKPISIIMDELNENILKVINDSKMPISIVDIIISNISNQIHQFAIEQAKQEKLLYEQSLELEKNKSQSN